MQTKTYTVYTYDELTEEQQQKAIERYYNINVDHDWWDFYSEDNAIDLKEFDLYRRDIRIDFAKSATDTAKYIVENHGAHCDTHITSANFLKEQTEIMTELARYEAEYDLPEEKRERDIESISLDIETCEERIEELAREYRDELAEDILANLQKEYDYLTSEEAIVETFRANEYEFTTDGRID